MYSLTKKHTINKSNIYWRIFSYNFKIINMNPDGIKAIIGVP